VRLELTHKFILGFTLVAATSFGLPPVLEAGGLPGWAAAGAAILVVTALGWLFSAQITRNIRSLRACTDRISRGDLSEDVDVHVEGQLRDETFDLAGSVRGMLENLRDLVEHIQRAADEVAGSSRDLSRSTLEVKVANQGIANTTDLVARGAAQQQKDAETASSRTREITDAIRTNAGAAREAFGFADEARQRATSGVEISRLTSMKMQRLFEQVDQAEKLVVRFDQKIRSVHRITEVITSVAEKTHLLSLNASIEAARAGDAGRGFSVVAEEIRKLAESATGSAEQIDALVQQVQQEAARVSEVTRSMGEAVSEGREDMASIFKSLERLQRAVQEAAQRSEVIFHKADSQVGEAERMVEDAEGIAAVARDNTNAIDDMRSGLRTQTDAMEKMVRQAARLSDMSIELGQVARKFRTR
jgi:methyl-accepting chemotaxis protein